MGDFNKLSSMFTYSILAFINSAKSFNFISSESSNAILTCLTIRCFTLFPSRTDSAICTDFFLGLCGDSFILNKHIKKYMK